MNRRCMCVKTWEKVLCFVVLIAVWPLLNYCAYSAILHDVTHELGIDWGEVEEG